MKKNIINGIAALTIGLAITSCSQDFNFEEQQEQQAINNAEQALGFHIPEGQDWVMSSQATAKIAVNGDYQANYDVIIYSNNPFVDNTGDVLTKGKVTSGGTFTADFRYPSDMTSVYVAIKDAKGYAYLKSAAIVDGVIETSFGNISKSKTRSLDENVADNFTIPSYTMPDLSAYIDDAVAISTENNITDPSNTVTHYLIPEGTTWSDNIPLIQSGSGISVYVQGTLNINAEQRVNGGCVFIVGPKGIVNIASETQLVTNANNEANTVGSFYVYPGGQVKGEGILQFANGSDSYNYNGGTIDVDTINNNGGTLYNKGTLKANVMMGGAGLSIYVNDGKVNIGNCAYGSGSSNTRILNNCWWDVDGYLFARNIVQGQGAYMHVGGNFEMSAGNDGTKEPSYYYAKANSLLDVEGASGFNNIDIVGPTAEGEYAYMQFGWIEDENRTHGIHVATNYTGWPDITCGAIINNIRLSIDNVQTSGACKKVINEMLNGTAGQEKQVGNGNAVLVQKNQYTAATVEESECSPGITINPPTEITETGHVWTYAFEDNTLKGDYDMNDVVLKVNEDPDDDTKLIIKLVAAGCEFDNNVYLGDTPIMFTAQDGTESSEVHTAFGVSSGTLVNTGNRSTTISYIPTATISKPANFDFQTADFSIVPSGGDSKDQHIRIATSGYPCGIVIPIDWAYPTERTNICTAYGEEGYSFGEWATSADHSIATDWYNHASGSVVR